MTILWNIIIPFWAFCLLSVISCNMHTESHSNLIKLQYSNYEKPIFSVFFFNRSILFGIYIWDMLGCILFPKNVFGSQNLFVLHGRLGIDHRPTRMRSPLFFGSAPLCQPWSPPPPPPPPGLWEPDSIIQSPYYGIRWRPSFKAHFWDNDDGQWLVKCIDGTLNSVEACAYTRTSYALAIAPKPFKWSTSSPFSRTGTIFTTQHVNAS